MPFYYDMGICQIHALPHMKTLNTTRGQTAANLGGASNMNLIYSEKRNDRSHDPQGDRPAHEG